MTASRAAPPRGRWILALALMSLGALAVGVWMSGPRVSPTGARGQAASAAPPEGVGALGRVEPASRVRKLSHPGGLAMTRVEQMLVEEGDEVAAGQVLATFADARLKDSAVIQMEAALLEARATLARVLEAGRPSEVAALRARIASLRLQEEIDRRDADRAERLMSGGAGPQAVAERGRFAAERSAALRAEAEAQLDTLSVPRPEDIAIAAARVANAEAALAHARDDAALSRLIAPIAGTVLRIHARAGDTAGAAGVLELADLAHLDVVADVFETDLPRVRIGAPATVSIPGDTQSHDATVRVLGWQVRRITEAGSDPVAATDARTVEVRLTLGDSGRRALLRRSNMQVEVSIRP